MRIVCVKKPGGLDQLQIEERTAPIPGPNDVLVQWKATSLNYHDYLVAIGAIPVEDQRIPMSDGAGEILAVGENVRTWQVGDRVMSMFFPNWIEGTPSLAKTRFISGETVDGYLCEQSTIPASAVTAIPNGYSFAEAATLPCAALTAWRGLMVEGNLQAGDKVLIEGTGGMSIFALQIAKAVGARGISLEISNDAGERMGPFATKHQMYVGLHNHTQVADEGFSFDIPLSYSDYNMLNLDIGHYVAGLSESPIPVIQKYHERITHLHLKDRKNSINGQDNVEWGFGDTPIADVLRLYKKSNTQLQR